MSKTRQIKTSFWSDSFIEELSPVEKLVYLYFLTNEKTDLCGIYEISLKRISYDTGINQKEVIKILNKFSECEKIFYINEQGGDSLGTGYIYIRNFKKYQFSNPSIEKGIERSLKLIPIEIKAICDRLYTGCVQGGTLKPIPILKPKPKLIEEKNIIKKEKYMEFVLLSENEKQKLIEDYGEDKINLYIEKLNDYIGSTGKKYKSHYHTIKTWMRKEKDEPSANMKAFIACKAVEEKKENDRNARTEKNIQAIIKKKIK